MFQLIAIKPLNGCAPWVLKCLRAGRVYYFCNDYTVADSEITLSDQYVRPLPDDFFSSGGNSGPHINVHAVVGKNGDGKSSLMELAIRLINNFAKRFRLCDRDTLLRVEGVKAELYYRLDDHIYRIVETSRDAHPRLERFTSNENHREWRLERGFSATSLSKMTSIFYTIVSNYSHYAYNPADFRPEWSDNVKIIDDDEEKCWLHYLFHKNDGYRTPLTLHPFRSYGNIDINRERELTLQRLMALYAMEPGSNEKPDSIRRLGNKEAELLLLTLEQETKLWKTSIRAYFADVKSRSALDKYIKKIRNFTSGKNSSSNENPNENAFLKSQEIHKEIQFETLIDDDFYYISESLDFLTGQNDIYYQRFLRGMIEILKKEKEKGLFSRTSDIRSLSKAIEKFCKVYDCNPTPIRNFCNKYAGFDELNVMQLKQLRLIYTIARIWNFSPDVLFKKSSMLNEVERSIHYIVYKSIEIIRTYPEYRDNLKKMSPGWFGNGLVFNDDEIKDIIHALQTDTSHVTLKLRQCQDFIRVVEKTGHNPFERFDSELSDADDARRQFPGSLLIDFDALRSFHTSADGPKIRLEQLPPPIYQADIVYRDLDGPRQYMTYSQLSSGEKQWFNNIGAVLYHLRNLDSVSDEHRKYKNVNILLEEVELYFHPELQRTLVKSLLDNIRAMNFKQIENINILFVTHSPFILSDIPLCNVLFLKDGIPCRDMQENTFGSNIHALLRHGFFLPSLPIGEFAHDKINRLFEIFNRAQLQRDDTVLRDRLYNNILRVGEPYLREQLMKMFNYHFPPQYDRAQKDS